MNVVALVGRIGNDPEMRYTPSGLAITKFRMGVTRQRKSESGEQETDWLDVVTFGKTAEFVSQYLDKGAHVGVQGRIQSRTWEAQDGSKRYAVEIVAENVEFMESKQEADRRRGARAEREGGAPPAAGGGGGYMPDAPPPGEDFFGD
jgi:single-strand DNA-binding protein